MWPGQQPPGGEQDPQDGNQNPQGGTDNPYQQSPQPGEDQPVNPYQQPAGGYGYPPGPPAPPQGGYGYPQQPPAPPQDGYGYPQPPAPPQDGYGYPLQPPAPAPTPDGYGYPQQGQYPQPPTAEQWSYAQPYETPGTPGGKRKTAKVAIIASVVVLLAAGGMGAYVLTQDDDKKSVADDKPTTPPSSSAPASPSANPRAGGEIKPTIPGWKVVVNPKYGTAFDVPPEWQVDTPDTYVGFADDTKTDGRPVTSFSAPAFLKEKWCSVDHDKDGDLEDYALAGTGTKGGQGAKDTASGAHNEAGNWVWAPYAQKEKSKIKIGKSRPFTTKSGLKGHYATATANGLKKENKCSTDGKSIAFTFHVANGDFASWVLYAPNNVKDELDHTVIKKIMSTVRLTSTN
ncbi:hypothetical protein [Streptomyces sp. NPDC089919]|uniref:hypothetical protein n=1 Tax=Streptomyces sp. NPDC089919 TaxID=3155188 RepID=UPI00341F37DE